MKAKTSQRKRSRQAGAPSASAREVFIVRLRSETRARPTWLGQVQHVRTGQVAYVRGLGELLAFLSSQMEQPDAAQVEPKGLK
jgi:hypothetical protein